MTEQFLTHPVQSVQRLGVEPVNDREFCEGVHLVSERIHRDHGVVRHGLSRTEQGSHSGCKMYQTHLLICSTLTKTRIDMTHI